MTWIDGFLFVLMWTLFAFVAGPLIGRYLLRPLFLSEALDDTMVSGPPNRP